MKRYFTYILSFVLISCIAACTKSEDVVNPNAEGHMALRLVSSTMTRSATSGNGVGVGENDDNLSEDKLVSADLYFFDGEGSGNAVWHHRATFTNQLEEATISELTIPSNIMSAIFNTNTSQATLYVVANAPARTLPTYEGLAEGETLPTMDELKAYTISTTSWKTSATPSSAQSSFVMDGEDKITKTNNEIGGTVALTRAAAKIELSITDVVSSVTVDGVTWTPVLGDNDNGSTILVSLNYAVGGSYINGVYDKTFANDNTQQNYGFARDAAVTDKKVYNQAHPFYSYASDWGTGGANEPYLLLVVPWISSKPGTSRQNTYYQIPVGSLDAKQIKRNHYYKVKINVGTMGSFEPQTATEITPSYTVIDWSTGSITTDIKEARYLVVDENKVVMNNVNSYSIPYASSHPVTLEIISVTKPNFSGKVATTNTYEPTSDNKMEVTPTADTNGRGNTNPFKLEDLNKTITLSHTLVNDNNSNAFDYAAYTITAKIYHTDNTSFSETITFTQYPAMYVEAYLNSDYKNDSNNNNDNAHDGYVWVNNGSNLGGVHGLGSATNANPNMYTITTTAFADCTYSIGDPRTTDYDNLNNWGNGSASAPALYDNAQNRRLKYYYSTDNSDATENMIAPKFRIASSYGVTTDQSYDNMKRRCASYQEDGYPAGRWRMPTKAELEYIVLLSAKGVIPKLFNDDQDNPTGDYWCAHGVAYPLRSGGVRLVEGTSGDHAVRCVYDDWYWGSERVKSTNANTLTAFTWGDQPRNTTN